MGTLTEDLEKYASEAYTKKDLKAGLKLLAELAGLATLFATAGILSTLTIPFLGPEWSRTFILKLSSEALVAYDKLSAQERREVRAVIRYARTAFGIIIPLDATAGIADRVDEASFFSGVADQADKVEELGDRLGSNLK